MYRVLILGALSGALALAQTPTAVVVVNHQPIEAFKAAFLTVIPGVGLYESTTCNMTEGVIEIGHGAVMQAASEKLTLVSSKLALVTMSRARQQSKLYKAARVTVVAAYLGALITTGAVANVPSGVQVFFPMLGSVSDSLSKTFENKGLAPGAIFVNFLDAEKSMTLRARGCETHLFLARYTKGLPETFATTLR